MKLYSKTLVFLFLIFALNLFSQKKYFKLNGSKDIIDEQRFEAFKKTQGKKANIEENSLKIVKNKDSIINYIYVGLASKTSKGIDPWVETKSFIGTKFRIEKFVDSDLKHFKSDYLDSKPTFVNFWFTRCPPCIEEIPLLNRLKEKFGDKVNFISVTFEDQKTVDEFLKKHKFDFKHIVNSKIQIDKYQIQSYPISFLLDKNGMIKILTPFVAEQSIQDIENMLGILLQ